MEITGTADVLVYREMVIRWGNGNGCFWEELGKVKAGLMGEL